MFICSECGVVTAPGEKEEKVVIETRPQEYRHKKFINRKEVEIITKGHETVKEVSLCPRCADRHHKKVELEKNSKSPFSITRATI